MRKYIIPLALCMLSWFILPANGSDTTCPAAGPFRLKPGDTVGLIAPANSLTRYDMERFDAGIAALEAEGLKVRYREDIRERVYGALAGKDHERAEEFMEMVTDPCVKAIFTIAGGYGSMRILDHIDWELVRQNPKIFAGFSDNTALHLAIHTRAGFPSVHSTGIIFLWGNPHPRPYALRHMKALILSSTDELTQLEDWGGDYQDAVSSIEVKTLHPGTAEGILVGGNLSLVTALTGTPYEPDWNGKIMFLEEVGEPLYRIDRMLMQLKLSGAFDKINGLILGRFVRVDAYEEQPDYTLQVVFSDLLGEYDYPVIYDFPTGHIQDNLPLPIGSRVRVSSEKPYLSILEDPFPIP